MCGSQSVGLAGAHPKPRHGRRPSAPTAKLLSDSPLLCYLGARQQIEVRRLGRSAVPDGPVRFDCADLSRNAPGCWDSRNPVTGLEPTTLGKL